MLNSWHLADLSSSIEYAGIVLQDYEREDDYHLSEDGLSEDETDDEERGAGEFKDRKVSSRFCQGLKNNIESLLELGPILHENLCAQRIHAEEPRRPDAIFQVSDPAMAYIAMIRERYGQAEDQLIDRLGEANWQRHQYIRKRLDGAETHDDRKTQDLDEKEDRSQSDHNPYSLFRDSGIGTSIPTQEHSTPSLGSCQSTDITSEQARKRVPPTPKEVFEGNAFKCFICGQMLSNIRNRVDWESVIHKSSYLRGSVLMVPIK